MTAIQPHRQTIAQLLPGVSLAPAVASLAVEQLALDHHHVHSGTVFIAVPGTQADGRDFISDAIAAGASAVFAEAEEFVCQLIENIPVISVPNLKQQISAIAGRFYAEPSAELTVIGITGTNGKTTCTQLLAQMTELNHQRGAVMGTLGYGWINAKGGLKDSGATTADAIKTQQRLAECVANGVDLVAMEVSSHGLEQGRVAAVEFSGAVFTNLTHDHLDYHGTLENYGQAKSLLFKVPSLKFRVINWDDDFGKTLMQIQSPTVPSWRYSVNDPNADVYADDITLASTGIQARVHTPWGEGLLKTALVGEFNLANVLAVLCACCARGETLCSVLERIEQLTPVVGRMERVGSGSPAVYVDYAHTPDSLVKALETLKVFANRQLWCVFGCGGDRDREKRPLMAAAAEKLADRIILTQDNPRHESPLQIIDDVKSGFNQQQASNIEIILDRREAIATAINNAAADDVILIAGKGHETYQQIGDQRMPFDDVKQARVALAQRQANH